jgi:hypothetical protein
VIFDIARLLYGKNGRGDWTETRRRAMLGRMDTELRAIADRLAIEDVLHRYSTAIDTRRFELLDEVFAAGGVGDYTAAGGIRGTLPEIKEWLANALAIFSVIQHLVTNVRADIRGDEATTSCYLFNPLGYATDGGKTEMLFCGGIYHDKLVRTPQGWRIRERVIQTLYLDGKLPGQ